MLFGLVEIAAQQVSRGRRENDDSFEVRFHVSNHDRTKFRM